MNYLEFKVWGTKQHVIINVDYVACVRGNLGHMPSAIEIELCTGTKHIVECSMMGYAGLVKQAA